MKPTAPPRPRPRPPRPPAPPPGSPAPSGSPAQTRWRARGELAPSNLRRRASSLLASAKWAQAHFAGTRRAFPRGRKRRSAAAPRAAIARGPRAALRAPGRRCWPEACPPEVAGSVPSPALRSLGAPRTRKLRAPLVSLPAPTGAPGSAEACTEPGGAVPGCWWRRESPALARPTRGVARAAVRSRGPGACPSVPEGLRPLTARTPGPARVDAAQEHAAIPLPRGPASHLGLEVGFPE